MEHLLELKTEINKLSDEELIEKFNNKPIKEGELNYYPVFALRLNKFKELIFRELVSERNVKIEFRTFKPSWYIAISVLDYCQDQKLIREMIDHIKSNWSKEDFEFFKDYVSKENKFKKYF